MKCLARFGVPLLPAHGLPGASGGGATGTQRGSHYRGGRVRSASQTRRVETGIETCEPPGVAGGLV